MGCSSQLIFLYWPKITAPQPNDADDDEGQWSHTKKHVHSVVIEPRILCKFA